MTADDCAAAVADHLHRRDRNDPFAWIRDATDAHRHQHGCWAYPYADGTLLGAVSGVTHPARVLELGTALAYTSCWWAASGARVDTVERDPLHVRLARANVKRAGLSRSVNVHEGDFDTVVPGLGGPYNLIFFDGYQPPTDLLDQLTGSLEAQGVVVTANLDLGHGRTRALLASAPGWSTQFVADLALSVRTSGAGEPR